jgi:hypothetical protein
MLLFSLLLSLISLYPHDANAQQFRVVQTCGTLPGPALAVGSAGTITMDTTGTLCSSGSGGGGGGLSVTDQAAWTQGASSFTPTGGVFNDAATLSSGQQGTVRLSAKREMYHVAADGALVTIGAEADAACAPAGSCTLIGLAKTIANNTAAALPAGSATIGAVNQAGAPWTISNATNVTATACSGTVATGGTAQNAFTAQTTLHGFTIANIDTTEPLWISFTTTAAASGTDSYPLPAATASTFAGFGSFTSPPGFSLNHALSVVAATNGHKYSCTWW